MEVDGIFGTVDIAISGLRAQNKQMEVITSNVANAQTTDAGNGEPYRRLEAKFKTDDETGGVSLDEVMADEEGYVAMPNVNLPVEMMNLNLATRAYQANAAILRRYQQMVETALELLR